MKVIDIIKSPLNEGLRDYVIRELIEFAAKLIASAEKYGKELPDLAILLRRKAPGISEKEIAKVEAEAAKRSKEILKAEKAAYDAEHGIIGTITRKKQEIGDSWKLFKTKVSFITDSLIALGCLASVGDAVLTYYTNVQKAYDQWAADKIPENDYIYIRQAEMSVLITKIAGTFALGVGTGTFRATMNFFGKIPLLGIPFRFLGTLTQTAQLALATYVINSSAWKEAMAYAAVYQLSELPIIGPAFKALGITTDISDYVGHGGVLLLDEFKAMLSEIPGVGSLMDKTPTGDKQATKPVDPAGDKQATGPTGTPVPAVGSSQDPDAIFKTGNWINTDGRFWKNLDNGDTVMSKDPTKLTLKAPVATPSQ